MAAAPLAAGAAPVVAAAPPALVPPTVLHAFQSIALAGLDPTLDYKAVDKNALLVKSWPSIGWVDASAAGANLVAAPCLMIQYVTTSSIFVEQPMFRDSID